MQYVKETLLNFMVRRCSISVKFLEHAEALDYKSNFTILDMTIKKTDPQYRKSCDLNAKKFSPQLVMYHIDQWKNKGLLPKM